MVRFLTPRTVFVRLRKFRFDLGCITTFQPLLATDAAGTVIAIKRGSAKEGLSAPVRDYSFAGEPAGPF
ncbi:hypothetical protein SAMN05216525_13083 [Bradyrhizobium sp. Gha]|nr:hypothetical protein SAMN05216525_13083 [Bradyrhizobium sp. Gha]